MGFLRSERVHQEMGLESGGNQGRTRAQEGLREALCLHEMGRTNGPPAGNLLDVNMVS